MGSVDTAITIVILFCGALGIYWGVIRQGLAIAGLISGLALASVHELEVADLLSAFIGDYTIARAVAFVLIVISVSSAASLIASLLRRFAGLLLLGWLDRLLGGMLGLLQGALVCTIVLIVATALPSELWLPSIRESHMAPLLIQGTGFAVLGFLPDSFRLAAHMMLGTP